MPRSVFVTMRNVHTVLHTKMDQCERDLNRALVSEGTERALYIQRVTVGMEGFIRAHIYPMTGGDTEAETETMRAHRDAVLSGILSGMPALTPAVDSRDLTTLEGSEEQPPHISYRATLDWWIHTRETLVATAIDAKADLAVDVDGDA